MKLYHVSLNLDIVNEFVPRVPSKSAIMIGEDDITPRICLAKSIRGCLTAVPWGGYTFEEIFFSNNISELIRVYEFDSEDIINGNLISSEELYQSDKVRDAEISGEVWVVNQELKPKKAYLIQINDYTEGSVDDIAYEDLKNFNEDEDDYDDIINGCFTTIEFIQYDFIGEDNCNTKRTFKFKLKVTNDVDEDIISSKLDTFLNEYWNDFTIDIKKTDEEDVFIVDLYIDLITKPTTLKNFLKLIKYDIGEIREIELIG